MRGAFRRSRMIEWPLINPDPAAAPAIDALQFLIWTFPFASVNYVLSTALTATDDQKARAWMLGVEAVFNIALNGILIPLYSFYGACVATLMTQAGLTGAMSVRYQRTPTQPRVES